MRAPTASVSPALTTAFIPDVTDPARHAAWVRVELAKRRLMYSILRLDLPHPIAPSGDPEPLIFDLLDDLPGRKVLTGHDNGVITIALREADDAERERARTAMAEPYRTLLGHFRHEVGHYYWDRLVRDGKRVEQFRSLFDDERRDYEGARQSYYANGPPPGWQDGFVSAYATMHPWEDFAESWAHYLHIMDTLETVSVLGLTTAPTGDAARAIAVDVKIDPYKPQSAEALLAAWLPTVFAVNSINRSMGQPDLYPFVISPRVVQKLDFLRSLVAE